MTNPTGGFLEGLSGGFQQGSGFKRGLQQDQRKRTLEDENRLQQRATWLRQDVAAGLTEQLTREQLGELARKRTEIVERDRQWAALRVDPTITNDPKYSHILRLPAEEGMKAYQDIASHPERYDRPGGAGGSIYSVPGQPVMRIGDDNTAAPITTTGGAPLVRPAEESKDSDARLRAQSFGETLSRINPLIADYEKRGVTPNAWAEGIEGAGNIPIVGGLIKPATQQAANSLRDNDQRQYRNYARQWMISVLRPESGGAISDQEFETYYKTYFKEPNDDPQTVAIKQQARLDKEREAGVRSGTTKTPPGTSSPSQPGKTPAPAHAAGASKPRYADNPY